MRRRQTRQTSQKKSSSPIKKSERWVVEKETAKTQRSLRDYSSNCSVDTMSKKGRERIQLFETLELKGCLPGGGGTGGDRTLEKGGLWGLGFQSRSRRTGLETLKKKKDAQARWSFSDSNVAQMLGKATFGAAEGRKGWPFKKGEGWTQEGKI